MKLSKNKITHSLAVFSLLALSGFANASSLAIINATVHTATDQGILENAVVVIEDGVITAINPASFKADTVLDAEDANLTPGLIAPMNQLGLLEVNAVAKSRDGSDEKADLTFSPVLAFNPTSTLIPYSRAGGITSAVIAPNGGKDIFPGQTSVVNLSGTFNSITKADNALLVNLEGKNKGSRALTLQTLINKLEDAQLKQQKDAKAANKKKTKKENKDADDKTPSREEQLILAVLSGEKTLVATADRAADLIQLIALKARFNLKLVIVGADDAVVVASQLAMADIPILIDPMSNLPSSFDQIHASLSNAGILSKAGIKVGFYERDTHIMYQLRFNAGNAVSYGMSKTDALKAMTANVAEAFNIDAGTIAVGKPADLVLWNGDFFDINSSVAKLWIGGTEYSTESRQDKLRNRYLKKTDMPAAYSE